MVERSIQERITEIDNLSKTMRAGLNIAHRAGWQVEVSNLGLGLLLNGLDYALNELNRLRKSSDWMPIESAPRDGSMILVFEKGAISNKRWDSAYSDWVHEFPGIPGNSHWMPLPPAPGEEKRGA